jgi:hypothetical protein
MSGERIRGNIQLWLPSNGFLQSNTSQYLLNLDIPIFNDIFLKSHIDDHPQFYAHIECTFMLRLLCMTLI